MSLTPDLEIVVTVRNIFPQVESLAAVFADASELDFEKNCLTPSKNKPVRIGCDNFNINTTSISKSCVGNLHNAVFEHSVACKWLTVNTH